MCGMLGVSNVNIYVISEYQIQCETSDLSNVDMFGVVEGLHSPSCNNYLAQILRFKLGQ